MLVRFEGVIHGWLVRNSITALRISLGAVFLGFGLLKYFPGASPAGNLTVSTISILTFGLVPDTVALVGTATLECLIGLSLLAGRGLRVTVYLLAVELLGILSPLVLLTGQLFSGPGHAPTIEGQYVLKDVILVAAGMVIATGFRGAKITHPGDSPAATPGHVTDGERDGRRPGDMPEHARGGMHGEGQEPRP